MTRRVMISFDITSMLFMLYFEVYSSKTFVAITRLLITKRMSEYFVVRQKNRTPNNCELLLLFGSTLVVLPKSF